MSHTRCVLVFICRPVMYVHVKLRLLPPTEGSSQRASFQRKMGASKTERSPGDHQDPTSPLKQHRSLVKRVTHTNCLLTPLAANTHRLTLMVTHSIGDIRVQSHGNPYVTYVCTLQSSALRQGEVGGAREQREAWLPTHFGLQTEHNSEPSSGKKVA